MKKIRLNRIECVKDKYCIYLDTGNVYYFKNKRDASDFLIVISKQLTLSIYYCNEEYCEIEMIYRQYFFIISSFQKRFVIENSLELIRNKISLVLFREGGENRNYIAVSGIELILLEIKSVYEALKEIAISRSDTAIRYKIDTKCRILDLFIKDFKNFEESIKVERSEIKIFSINKLRKVI